MMNKNLISEKMICPFFKNNRCTYAKLKDQLKKTITTMYCATEDHINCPIYKRKIKEKQADYPKQDSNSGERGKQGMI